MMDDLDLEQLKKELGDTPDGGGRFTVEDILREAEQEQGRAAAEQTYSLIEQQDELTGADEAQEESNPLMEQENVFAKMMENIEQSRPDDAPTAERSLADERMDAFARMIAEMETENDEPEQEEPAPEPPKKARRKPKVRDVSLEHGINDLEPDEPETDEMRTLPFSQSESGWEELESEANDEPDDEDYEEQEEPRGLLSRIFGETEEESDEQEEAAEAQPRGGFWSKLFGGSREEREEQPAPAAEQPEEDAWADDMEEPDEMPETEDESAAEPPEEELVTVPEADEPEDKSAPREGFWSHFFRMNDAMANDFSDLDDDEPEEDCEDAEEDEYDEELDDEEYVDDEDDENEEDSHPRGGFLSRLFGRTEKNDSGRYDEDIYDEDDLDEDVLDEEDERELPEETEPEDDAVTVAFAEAEPEPKAEEEALAQETRVMPELPESEPKPLTEEELLAQTRVIGAEELHDEPGITPEQAEKPVQDSMDVAGSDFWSRLFGTDSLRPEQNAASETTDETRVMPELRAEEQRPLTYEELLAQTRVVPAVREDAEELPNNAETFPDFLAEEPAQPAISEEELQEFLTDARSSEEVGASFEELLRDSGVPETPEKPKKIEFDAFPEKETTVYFDIAVPEQTEATGEEPRRAELFDAEEALEEAEEQRARQEEKRRLIEDSTDDSWIGLSLDELSKLAPSLEELRREGPVMVREVERQKERIVERRRRYLEKREAERRAAEAEQARAAAQAELAADEMSEIAPEQTDDEPDVSLRHQNLAQDASDNAEGAKPEESEESPVFL